MGRKTCFKREDVVKAGLELVEEGGFENLSSSKVAKKLNSSVKPIYSNWRSMGNLKRDVTKVILEKGSKYILRDYGEEMRITNLCIGQVLFARDHKNLYRSVLIEKHDDIFDLILAESNKLYQICLEDKAFSEIPVNYRNSFYGQVTFYIAGVTSTICNDWMTDDWITTEALFGLVTQTINALYQGLVVQGIRGNRPKIDIL